MNGELIVSPEVEESQGSALVERMDETFIQKVEAIAANITPVRKAMERIITEMTYRDDWVVFDDKVALGSAGAGRLLKTFPFTFSNWTANKETWSDELGEAYRWVYECECELWGSKVLVTGKYSTRDKFLGKAHGELRPVSSINENDIRSAAQHIAIGAGIKELLGLRNMPKSELDRIFGSLQREGSQTKTAGYEAEEKGDLSEAKKKTTELLDEMFGQDEVAKTNALKAASLFTGKDGKDMFIKSVAACKSIKWLRTTYGKLKTQKAELDKEMEGIDTTDPHIE